MLPPPREAISYHYTISPPFRIGDTSTVRYYLTTNYSLTSDSEVQLGTSGMKLVSNLMPVRGGINKGETLEYEIQIVHLDVRDVHKLFLRLIHMPAQGGDTCYSDIACYSLYNNDGSLRLVSDRTLWDVDSTLLPTAFRPMGEGDREEITLDPGQEEMSRKKF